MKKLALGCVLAAISASVFAQGISSQNVVGYATKDLRDNGQLLTASFMNAGQNEKFLLSDIKLTGYEEQFDGWTSDDFNFCRLTSGGSTSNALGDYFYWEDQFDGNGGYWCDADGNPVTKDNDYEFDAGEAIWFTAPVKDDGSTSFGFVTSGQVRANDCTFELRDNGNVVGNPFPYTIKLSSITLDGYQEEFDGWTSDDFNFCRKTAGGSTTTSLGNYFYWEDPFDGNGGYWCDADGNPVNEENDYDILPGEGFWFTAPEKQSAETRFVLEFGALPLG